MIQRIINNFFLRNALVFCIGISTYILEDIRVNKSAMQIGYTICLLAEIYLFFIFHNRVLYEYLLTKKRYIWYVIVLLMSLTLWREITGYLEWLLIRNPDTGRYPLFYHIHSLRTNRFSAWLVFYWINFYYIYTSLGIYFLVKYIRQRERLLKVENMQRGMELKHLNEQLNPHFLFNALNNIYSYTMGRGADAGNLVLKLSDIMRYILNNSKKGTVNLSEEIKFIEDYMAFELERVGKRCTVSYKKNIDGSSDFYIVPLILFNFIENAFKHGTLSASTSEVAVHISRDSSWLLLYTCNKVCEHAGHSTQTGHENAARRLKLLYPNAHTLEINVTDNMYQLSLNLKNKLHEAELHYSGR